MQLASSTGRFNWRQSAKNQSMSNGAIRYIAALGH
jgi:hypothetical protein